MRISLRTVGLAAIFALAVGVTPAGAFHENALPIVEQQLGVGNGWRAYQVTTNGSEHAIDIETRRLGGPAQAGAYFYTATGAFNGGFVFTAFPGKNGVLLRVDAGIPETDTRTTTGGPFGLGLTVNAPEFGSPFVGTRHIVIWWTSASTSWDITFRAASGTQIDAVDSGPEAYIVPSSQFRQTAQVEAYRQSLGARASVEASHGLAVGDTLIGLFQMGLTSAGTMSISTPAGEQSCSSSPVVQPFLTGGICLFGDMQGPRRYGPGDYTFRTTSAGAGFAGAFDDVWFGGADARLASVPGV